MNDKEISKCKNCGLNTVFISDSGFCTRGCEEIYNLKAENAGLKARWGKLYTLEKSQFAGYERHGYWIRLDDVKKLESGGSGKDIVRDTEQPHHDIVIGNGGEVTSPEGGFVDMKPSDTPKPGGFCEVCWSNAFSRMIANPSKSQTEHYEDLIKELSLPFGGNPHKVEPKPVGLYNPIKAIEEDGGNPEGWNGKPKPDGGKDKEEK